MEIEIKFTFVEEKHIGDWQQEYHLAKFMVSQLMDLSTLTKFLSVIQAKK
jgi:hypothetical protein